MFSHTGKQPFPLKKHDTEEKKTARPRASQLSAELSPLRSGPFGQIGIVLDKQGTHRALADPGEGFAAETGLLLAHARSRNAAWTVFT